MKKKSRNYCPKCGMELLEFSYRSIRIDQCCGCEGIWLDPGELETIERLPKENLFSMEFEANWVRATKDQLEAPPEEMEERKLKTYMRCPRCASPLKEDKDHGFPVDRCTQCGGVWLDPGEIDQLAGMNRLSARLHRFVHRK